MSLDELISLYYEDKQKLDQYKKSTEEYNSQIKSNMNDLDIKEYDVGDLSAKITIQKRENFIEDKLINKLKELNAESAIKTKEYVDMDELENLIYNGVINASELSDCRTIKEVVTLKVTKRKE